MSQGGGPPLFGVTEAAMNAVSSFAPSFPIPLALAGGGKKKKKKRRKISKRSKRSKRKSRRRVKRRTKK